MTVLPLPPSHRFPHGRVCMTSRVIDLVRRGELDALGCLERHLAADWGDVPQVDKQANDAGLSGGDLLVSRYKNSGAETLVILTIQSRRLTKLMLGVALHGPCVYVVMSVPRHLASGV